MVMGHWRCTESRGPPSCQVSAMLAGVKRCRGGRQFLGGFHRGQDPGFALLCRLAADLRPTMEEHTTSLVCKLMYMRKQLPMSCRGTSEVYTVACGTTTSVVAAARPEAPTA